MEAQQHWFRFNDARNAAVWRAYETNTPFMVVDIDGSYCIDKVRARLPPGCSRVAHVYPGDSIHLD